MVGDNACTFCLGKVAFAYVGQNITQIWSLILRLDHHVVFINAHVCFMQDNQFYIQELRFIDPFCSSGSGSDSVIILQGMNQAVILFSFRICEFTDLLNGLSEIL